MPSTTLYCAVALALLRCFALSRQQGVTTITTPRLCLLRPPPGDRDTQAGGRIR
jgi:hypothetical protein